MQRRAARGVDQAFPEALKEPVLRKIQFSTVSRLDHLVEDVYEVPNSPLLHHHSDVSNSKRIITLEKP
jgi:hypothetical protein